MKVNLKKIISLSLAIAMILLTILTAGGCKQKADALEEEVKSTVTDEEELIFPEWKRDISPITITVFSQGEALKKWKEDDIVAKAIKEKTGVWTDFIIKDARDEYMNLLLASGDLPDVVISPFSNEATRTLIDNKMVHNLSGLIDEYAPSWWETIPDDYFNYHKQKDGKLYYMVNSYRTKEFNEFPTQFGIMPPVFHNGHIPSVRKDIYEALGEPDMSTPDNLINVLKQVRDKYPDVIPLGFSYTPNTMSGAVYFIPHFLYGYGYFISNSARLWDDNGKARMGYSNPAYYKTAKLFNQLYKEGLFTKEVFTDREEQFNEKLVTGKYFYAPHYQGTRVNNKIKEINKSDARTYVTGEQLMFTGEPGHTPKYLTAYSTGWLGWMISSKAKNPERIIRYMQFLWSYEGSLLTDWGIEGETFKWEEVEAVGGKKVKIPVLFPDATEKTLVRNSGSFMANVELLSLMALSGRISLIKDDPGFAKVNERILNNYRVADDWGVFSDVWPVAGGEESVILQRLDEYWAKTLVELFVAESDEEFNRIYNEALQSSKNMGEEKLEAYIDERVQHNRELIDFKK